MLRGSSLKDSRKPKKPDATMPGFSSGASMCQKRCQADAPRSDAASVRRSSKRAVTTSIASSANGNAQTKWPRTSDQTPIFSPRSAL